MLVRRSFLIGLASSLTAPAIVHAGNLMLIKPIMVRGIWWKSMSNNGTLNFHCYYDLGQISTVGECLKPLQHFLDLLKLPPDTQDIHTEWGILN